MSEPMLKIERGFAPYSDGSGHQIEITIERTDEKAEPTISIERSFRVPASEWIAAARKIEHLLDAAAHTPQENQSE